MTIQNNDAQSGPSSSTLALPLPGDTNGTTGANTTVLAPPPMRAVAASVAEKSVFVAWQNSDNDLLLNVYFDGNQSWRTNIALATDAALIVNTPLTVLAWQYNEYFVRVFPFTPLRTVHKLTRYSNDRRKSTSITPQLPSTPYQALSSAVAPIQPHAPHPPVAATRRPRPPPAPAWRSSPPR
jgi:hypothetical protein